MEELDIIIPNTCPYCGGPYALYKPCTCREMQLHHGLIADAADADITEQDEVEHDPTYWRDLYEERAIDEARGK